MEQHATLQVLRDHVAKGALSMIEWANHKPANRASKPKVGGHQASSMSSVDLLCAFYLHALEPQDRIVVKPHAAPILYSLLHQMGVVTSAQMGSLREFKGLQPYPTKLKNPLFVDYTSSSEGLGVAATIYDAYGAIHHNLALADRYTAAHANGTYWAHCGDGELTEGQVDESLYDAGRWRLSNLVWIVDLNRQSLDRVMDDSGRLEHWAAAKFMAQGWSVQNLRWGSRARALFAKVGGNALQAVLERIDDAQLHPLLMGPSMVTPQVMRVMLAGKGALGDPRLAAMAADWSARVRMSADERNGVDRILKTTSDAELAAGIGHLGGHDMAALIDAYANAREAEGPQVIIAHTIKGYETSAAGHPENHGGLLPGDEVAGWGLDRGLPPEIQYPVVASESDAGRLIAARRALLFAPEDHLLAQPSVAGHKGIIGAIPFKGRTSTSSGEAFQSLNLALLRTEVGPLMQFGAPDVGQTTHLGPIIKSTGVFAPRELPDTFKWMRQGRQLTFDWRPTQDGQFHAMGIAEGNAMLWAYAFGRQRKSGEGKTPLLPVVTVYDKFFERGFNQLDYATYSNARFIAVGTPSGTGLSRETATHQSLQTLRMMMDLPGIIAYEPAFAADVHAIYLHALASLWDDDGEAWYLRLSTQRLKQPKVLPDDHAQAALRGGYWLIGEDQRDSRFGAGSVIFVASGRKLAQAREAAERLHVEDGVGSRILNVTSYEALWRDWDAWADDPNRWPEGSDGEGATYYLNELFAEADVNAPMIITGDHLPSASEWLPGALMRLRGARFCGPRRNGEAGDLESIDRLHGMHTDDLVEAARAELRWRATVGLT